MDITRKFTGHDWDNDVRLYYTAFRYYSPDSNRWLTRDPLGMVDGPNVYAYVMGNPVTYVDPDGQAIFLPLLFVMGLVSLVALLPALRYTEQLQFGGTVVGDGAWLSGLFSCKGMKFCIGMATAMVGVSGDVYLFSPGAIEGTVGIDKFTSVGAAVKGGFGFTGHVGAGVSVPFVNGSVTLLCFDSNNNIVEGSGLLER